MNIKNITFVSHHVKYSICDRCSHLNGIYEDTNSFNKKIYLSESGSNYINAYRQSFNSRVKKIYQPKVEFLKKVLKRIFL